MGEARRTEIDVLLQFTLARREALFRDLCEGPFGIRDICPMLISEMGLRLCFARFQRDLVGEHGMAHRR